MKRIFFPLLLLFIAGNGFAQLSPPGLGRAQSASWFAFGLRQPLDSGHHKQSLTYVGIGRKSNPTGGNNPFQKGAIFVLNQEFYNHYAERWQYSYALSYRREQVYEAQPPYGEATPSAEQEFRVYGRYSYILPGRRLKFTNTLRQEFRKFFTPDFGAAEENFQLRTRYKTQLAVSLDAGGVHKIIGTAEALFAISRLHEPQPAWTAFAYKESRFNLYYSLSPKSIPFTFDLGYMNNLIGTGHNTVDVPYLALDVVWERPFGKK